MTGCIERLINACVDWNGADMANGEPPRDTLRCGDLREVVLEFNRLKEDRDESLARMVKTERRALDVFKAGEKALSAIDNILTAHTGQSEHADLMAAFSALEAALNKAEGLPG